MALAAIRVRSAPGALVVPTLSKVTGTAVAIAGGPAVLVPALSKVLGAGLSELYGVAPLVAQRAIIEGVVVGIEGTGDLVAQAASVSGEGRIDEPFIWQPDEPRGSYPYYDPAVWYPNPGTALAYPLATGLWHGRGTATWYEVTKPNMTKVHGDG